MKRKPKRHPKRDCTFPPVIPTRELPNLMFKRDSLAVRAVHEYVESQARDEKVTHAERLATEYVPLLAGTLPESRLRDLLPHRLHRSHPIRAGSRSGTDGAGAPPVRVA